MQAATLESRLEELEMLRTFSRPRISKDNPFSESLLRTVKYLRMPPEGPSAARSRPSPGEWSLDWCNHRRRHSTIRFVTGHERHGCQAVTICRQRGEVYGTARQRHPRRWSRGTRCWCQPEVAWTNPQPVESAISPALVAMAV
jgi:hypothetical protein